MFGLTCDPACIQAIASIILVIITILYVIITYKLVHAPHTAFLQPEGINLQNIDFENWLITIKNFGPGVAVSVRVYIRILKKLTFAPTKNNPQRVFMVVGWVEAKGASTISNGSTESYKFKGLIRDLAPIRTEWKLITGKRRRGIWFYKTIDNKFLTKEGIHKIVYYWHRVYESIKSPYYIMQREYCIRKVKKASKNKT